MRRSKRSVGLAWACAILLAIGAAAIGLVRSPRTATAKPSVTPALLTRSAPPNAAPPGWNIRADSLVIQGHPRYFLVARPDIVTSASLPVLLVLPGRGMSPAAIERASGFLEVVGQAVVVYPAGFGESWNAGYCCGAAHLDQIDDVAFLEAVIHSVLASQPGTSATRVYLAGFSNGGRMAYDMACADPGAFAGIAAVEAVAVSSCDRTRPVPMVQIASTGDPLLTISDRQPPKVIAGHVEVTVEDLVAHWRNLDGCRASSPGAAFPALTLTEWSSCEGGGRVALAVYQGGRHAWPVGSPGTPPAQAVIWDFFRDLPVTPSAPALHLAGTASIR